MNNAISRNSAILPDLDGFNYGAPAELFPSRVKKGRGRITYKRFDTAAEALRFAVEEIPGPVLLGAYLEVDEGRFGMREIRHLYESAGYPLKRGPKAIDSDASARAASTNA